MIVASASNSLSPDSSWMSDRGGWAAYGMGVIVLHVILRLVLNVPEEIVWTATNVVHNLLMYVIMHTLKGVPWLSDDQGENRRLTYWEQIDCGMQFTDTKKFLTIFPIALFIMVNHAQNYSLLHFVVNLLSLVLVLLPKMPILHKKRLFEINKY